MYVHIYTRYISSRKFEMRTANGLVSGPLITCSPPKLCNWVGHVKRLCKLHARLYKESANRSAAINNAKIEIQMVFFCFFLENGNGECAGRNCLALGLCWI